MAVTTDLGAVPASTSSKGVKVGRGRTKMRLLQLLTFVVALMVWAIVTFTGLISPLALPSPIDVGKLFAIAVISPEYWLAVGQTLGGALIGLIIAAVVGIPLGLVTGTYSVAEKSSRLLVDMLRSFPVIAILPVFLLIIGSNDRMKITVVFIACVFPIFLQAQYGAQSVGSMVAETVRCYRIPRLLRFRKVILPAATPSIMTGVRLAATTAVLVAVGVEILTTLPGVGHQVLLDQINGNTPRAYVFILTAGLLGYAVNFLSELAEKRLLRWRPPVQS